MAARVAVTVSTLSGAELATVMAEATWRRSDLVGHTPSLAATASLATRLFADTPELTDLSAVGELGPVEGKLVLVAIHERV